jgi:hypothetical protein
VLVGVLVREVVPDFKVLLFVWLVPVVVRVLLGRV